MFLHRWLKKLKLRCLKKKLEAEAELHYWSRMQLRHERRAFLIDIERNPYSWASERNKAREAEEHVLTHYAAVDALRQRLKQGS